MNKQLTPREQYRIAYQVLRLKRRGNANRDNFLVPLKKVSRPILSAARQSLEHSV